MTNNKYVNFILNYFMAFGAAMFILMFLRNSRPSIFEPNNLYAIAVGIFFNLLVFNLTFRANVSLKEYWSRRLLFIGIVAISTPFIFIAFGRIPAERRLIYILTSAGALELMLFVVYLILDWRATRMTIDKINEILKKNREE